MDIVGIENIKGEIAGYHATLQCHQTVQYINATQKEVVNLTKINYKLLK